MNKLDILLASSFTVVVTSVLLAIVCAFAGALGF